MKAIARPNSGAAKMLILQAVKDSGGSYPVLPSQDETKESHPKRLKNSQDWAVSNYGLPVVRVTRLIGENHFAGSSKAIAIAG